MIQKFHRAFNVFAERPACCIQDSFYTYSDLQHITGTIQEALKSFDLRTNAIALIFVKDHVEIYASILASWFSGMCYVPLKADHPVKRNQRIIDQIQPDVIITSQELPAPFFSGNIPVLHTNHLVVKKTKISLPETASGDLAYILFTSGSTGTPKGVKITFDNIGAFLENFISIGYQLDEHDRFLQMYDLTFDASVHCFTLPWYVGGCMYTVPSRGMKYLNAYKILEKHEITFAKMPPSTIAYLEPYFNKMTLPRLKYSIFGGEALPKQLIDKWTACVPNALIQNVYGPTEATINCTSYKVGEHLKSHNLVVSIGKTFGDNHALVINEHNNVCKPGERGELCISGTQVTPGYWKEEIKNQEAFLNLPPDKGERYYRTGDLVFFDEQGDMYYCGRLDHQVQIQGFRVELGEIEKHAREFTGLNQVVAVGLEEEKQTSILLFLENFREDINLLRTHLATELPSYMIPSKIINVATFPLTTSGKIDRKKLIEGAATS
jgi:amino acid adenylation domain-containing protein